MVNIREVLRRLVKYLVEGLVVGFAAFALPKNKLPVEEIFWIALIAGMTFSILDMFTPSIAITARQGAGFGIGAGLVGFP
jgi:hypothetical protein